MEFKFSCKWFEISFSGDPGYIEKQIQLYEPFIFQVLKRMEEDLQRPAQKLPEIKVEPAHAPSPPPERSEQDDQTSYRDRHRRDRKRHNHFDKNRSNWKDRSPNQAVARNGAERPEPRPEPPRPERESPKAPEEDDDKAQLATEGAEFVLNPPEHTRPYPLPFGEPEPDLNEPDEGNEPEHSNSGEFSSRRRTPRIRADELLREIESKKPRTHHDRVMVFGHYMESAGGGSDFTVAEIKRCYRAIDIDPGSNIEQVINHATRSGFIVRFDQSRTTRFKLSNKGKRYVEEGLKLT